MHVVGIWRWQGPPHGLLEWVRCDAMLATFAWSAQSSVCSRVGTCDDDVLALLDLRPTARDAVNFQAVDVQNSRFTTQWDYTTSCFSVVQL